MFRCLNCLMVNMILRIIFIICKKILLKIDDDAILCQIFPTTLSTLTTLWIKNLPSSLISNFIELSEVFISHNQMQKRTLHSLFSLRQRNNESLREFVSKFKEELLLLETVYSEGATTALKEGLKKECPLIKHLVKHNISSIDEALSRAKRYIRLEGKQL